MTGDDRTDYFENEPPPPRHAIPNRVQLAEFLRYSCDASVMTDDETAAMLEDGDQFDWMARKLIEDGWVR